MTNRAVTRAFGEGAAGIVWKPAAGGEFPINAVFDEAFVSVELSQGVPVTSTAPMLCVELERLPAEPVQEDRYTRVGTGKTYEVVAVQYEGHGTARLISFEVRP